MLHLVFFLHLRSRYQLRKQVMIEANTIGEHLRQNDRFDMVFYHPAVDLRHVVTDYNAFKSRVGFMVMMALNDGNYNIIGSHGMGGVGNIILMEEIAR
ncbi:hypothetical protein GQ457_06G021070 [Hibiscus cannabinus]